MKELLKKYETEKTSATHFKFFAFWSPKIEENQYMWVKDCGYTHLYVDAKYGAELGSKELKTAIELCGKCGLSGVVNRTPFSKDSNDYKECVGFDGANADEPLTKAELKHLSQELDLFNEKYPDKWFYVNCPAGLIGYDGDAYLDNYESLLTVKMSHKCISGDDYPLLQNPADSPLNRYFGYLKKLADFAKKTDSEFYFFLQTMSITHFKGTARRPSLTDLRFLHSVLLAFGVKGFQHFCYKTPALPPFNGEFTEQDWALIDCYDRKTPLYDMTKQVINEIRVFERVYFDFVWEGLIASVGTENENKDVFNLTESLLDRFSLLQNVVSDRNAVIGCFRHKNENLCALFLASGEEPDYRRPCSISLKFERETEVLKITGKGRETIVAENGVLNVELTESEGCFIVFEAKLNPDDVMEQKPRALSLTAVGELTFVSESEKNHLFVNGKDKGLILSGENVADRCEYGRNEIFICGEQNGRICDKSKAIGYYLPTKDNVSVSENYCQNVAKVQPYNKYGSGNTVVEIIDNGYPFGGDGKVVKISTATVKDHDWSCFQFLVNPIKYVKGKKLYVDLYVTDSVFGLTFSLDPLNANCPSYEIKCMDKSERWIRVEVPLDSLNHDGNDIIENIYITAGGDKPYGTLIYINGYFIER